MDRQDELLEKEDGRYYAIDKFDTGLASLATTEKLNKTLVSFGLPSGPALFLHLAHNAFTEIKDVDPITLFDDHQQGIWPDSQLRLFDFLERSIAHVVFSFTAIEAFANEAIPETFTYEMVRKGIASTLNKQEIERWVSLDEKLHAVLPKIFSLPTPKGKHVWDKYKAIKDIRDRIIHLKMADRKASGPEVETIWGELLREHKKTWCDDAHEIIGYFEPAVRNRRWFKKYPY